MEALSKPAALLIAINENPNDKTYDDLVISVASEIVEANKALRVNPEMAKRYFASFTQTDSADQESLISKFLARAEALKTSLSTKKETLEQEQKKAEENKLTVDSSQQQTLALMQSQLNSLTQAIAVLNQRSSDFKAGLKPLTQDEVKALIAASQKTYDSADKVQTISLDGRNPFVQAILIDFNNEKIDLKFYPDVQKVRLAEGKTEEADILRDKVNNLVINDIARAGRIADENLAPDADTFAVALTQLPDPHSFLALNLTAIAEKQSKQFLEQLQELWQPKHLDLSRQAYPIHDFATYSKLKPEEQKLGLVIYVPSAQESAAFQGLNEGSIYVIARGMDNIIQKYRQAPDSPERQELLSDIDKLNNLLQLNGFVGYSGTTFGLPPQFSKDYIFELNDYYQTLLKATRENFYVKGSKRFALLDFTDVEQRILTTNTIEDHMQEDLLKWEEEYRAAQVDLDVTNHYLVPAPTKNPYWQNFVIKL